MSCPWGSRIVDVALSEETDLNLIRHLRECALCRADLSWIQTVHQVLSENRPNEAAVIERVLTNVVSSSRLRPRDGAE